MPEANPKVFFDIFIGKMKAGRVVMRLFANVTPKEPENLCALCMGEKGLGKAGKALHFKGSASYSPIHVPRWRYHSRNGTGGESIYGSKFDDENFKLKHTGPGILSMVNQDMNDNGPQFFICTAKTSWLDGYHVVFGKVVDGYDIVKKMEKVGSSGTGDTSKPFVVKDCGGVKNESS